MRERGQQHLVDAPAGLGELRGGLGVERPGPMPLAAFGARRGLACRTEPGLPPGELGQQFGLRGIGGQVPRPVAPARQQLRQRRRVAGASGVIGVQQVVEQDPPGHAVDRDVVHHDQQARALGRGERGRAQQGARAQAEAAVQALGMRGQRRAPVTGWRARVQVDRLEGRLGQCLGSRHDALRPGLIGRIASETRA